MLKEFNPEVDISVIVLLVLVVAKTIAVLGCLLYGAFLIWTRQTDQVIIPCVNKYFPKGVVVNMPLGLCVMLVGLGIARYWNITIEAHGINVTVFVSLALFAFAFFWIPKR